MKLTLKKLLALALMLTLCVTALASCGDSDITLIEGGEAQFKVVYTTASGATVRRAANDFVKELQDLGVEVDDAVSDSDSTEVTDCEIILGTEVENRGDECVVSVDDIGENGYVIKAVGKRIIIAGGTADGTKDALATFKEKYLGITEDTDSLTDASVKGDLLDEFVTSNRIVVFDINGTPINDFKIVTDYGKDERISALCPKPAKLVQAIKDAMDIDLATADAAGEDTNEIIVRLVDEAGEDGFRAFIEGKDLVIECAYYNLFDKAFDNFIADEIRAKRGEVSLDKDYLYTYVVSSVKYSDFGAVADGKTNDYEAILKTHEFANQCGQTVLADKRATYYIGLTGGKSIPVKTNVNWGDATFTVDDTVAGIYAERGTHIFHIIRDEDNAQVDLTADEIKQLAGTQTPQILRTYDQGGKLISGKIPWLTPKLTSGAMLILKNDNHNDYVRFGGNRNSGSGRIEVIMVDKNGNIDATTPVTFDFEEITSIGIVYTDDEPITIEGGRFYNICCKVDPATNNKNKYTSFARGILVERSNTTIKNLNHKMKNEPKRYVNGKDNLSQSYPYYGFIVHSKTYNSKVLSCDLTGHKVYGEDKSAATGAVNPVAMGTYDLIIQYSIGSYFERVTQSAVAIHDSAYWGMMASNYSRNMTFKSCSMSRFDAHCGFWNADLIDCDFGLCINVVGGGKLNVIGTNRYTGPNFISLRGDYGATFEGDIVIKDCEYYGAEEYNSETGGAYDQDAAISQTYILNAGVTNGSYGVGTKFEASYYTWDFGYKCYMPQIVTIDNFTYHGEKIAVYNGVNDSHFIKQNDDDEIYEPTKKIIFKNMTDAEINAIPNCFFPANTPMVGAFPREIVK